MPKLLVLESLLFEIVCLATVGAFVPVWPLLDEAIPFTVVLGVKKLDIDRWLLAAVGLCSGILMKP